MRRSLEGHLHGGDPARDLARFGLGPRQVRDFSVNLSPLGPPPKIRELWPELWRLVEGYPSLDGAGVRAFYHERFGLPADRVLAGNGATELIYLAPRALGLERVAYLPPAYDDYRRATELAGAEAIPIVRSDPLITPEAELLDQGLDSADALFVGQPNNPTGALLDPLILRRLARAHPKKWLLVDESFIQFTDDFPQTSLALQTSPARADSISDPLDHALPENVVVFHSLTKFYALAGLRLGAAIATPETLARLRAVKEPWTVNAIADRVARELASCRTYERRVRHLVREERARLSQRLSTFDGVDLQPGSANFLLARWTLSPLDELLRDLLQDGICVRDARNFQGLEDGWFRLAVRGHDDNSHLLASLKRLTRQPGIGSESER
ncbi:MAG: threonine-phosphate decarboxylase CobD [Acidobacteriota bacterium]